MPGGLSQQRQCWKVPSSEHLAQHEGHASHPETAELCCIEAKFPLSFTCWTRWDRVLADFDLCLAWGVSPCVLDAAGVEGDQASGQVFDPGTREGQRGCVQGLVL